MKKKIKKVKLPKMGRVPFITQGMTQVPLIAIRSSPRAMGLNRFINRGPIDFTGGGKYG